MIREFELPVFTFGWELEATGRAHRVAPDVIVGHDGSVSGDGLEYRTRREAVWDPERSLSALRTLVMDPGLTVNRSCGFHVHVGLGMKTRKLHSWAANFVTLARLIEAEAMEAVPESRRRNTYCRSWSEHRGSVMAPVYHGNKHSNETRYCWINPVEIFRPGGIRTIEVRLMGETKNYLYLLAWTSFCRKMAASAWALIHDPSRLQEEVDELREVLKWIKAAFITHEVTGKAKAKGVVLLAAKSGFYESLVPSLGKIKEVEKSIRYAMDRDARARDVYAQQIESIREYNAKIAESLAVTHSATQLLRGSMVEALISDSDGMVLAGRVYEVIEDNIVNGTTQVRVGQSGWWIERSQLKLAQRRESPVAV